MVIELLKEDLKRLLDKNAIFMSFLAVIFNIATYFVGAKEGARSGFGSIFRTEGIVIIFLIYVLEFAKVTLTMDKITKKIEFLLANGVKNDLIISKYILSLYFATFIVLIPTFIITFINVKIELVLILNLVFSSILFTVLIVYLILFTRNMNRVNGLQISMIIFSIVINLIAIEVYRITNVVELYLIVKVCILVLCIGYLSIKTSGERIVVSYYWYV